MYCAPTSLVMGLYWLANNGFTQLAPQTYSGQKDPRAINLERIIGLIHTSVNWGTYGGMVKGMATYFSACGIPPDHYVYTGSDHPGLDWPATQLAPNTASNPSTIVYCIFMPLESPLVSNPIRRGFTWTSAACRVLTAGIASGSRPHMDALEVRK